MYGLVNLAIEELVRAKFGDEKWEKVRELAGVPTITFNRMHPYPDELTYKLVGAVSQALGISTDDALFAFGEFWVLYTGRHGYGHMFDLAGSSFADFLGNLDNLHSRVGQNFSQLKPPSFQCEKLSERQVRLHYFTDRGGLCPMVRGLITGLGQYFHTPVSLSHEVCVRSGAEHCEFLIDHG